MLMSVHSTTGFFRREPHFDFVRDKKTNEANDRRFQGTQEETCPNDLLQSMEASLLCVAIMFTSVQ